MLFFTIIVMQILIGAEIDLFVPSFPELQQVFSLTPFAVEMILSLNLAVYCITSLIVGNLGDRYGRRPILLAGLVIFVAGSILCTLAQSYTALLIGRILQGGGAAGPAVLSYLVIADLYPPREQQRKIGILNGMTTVGMAAAPIAGSYIADAFGWRGNFAALLILGIICLIMGAVYIPKGVGNPAISLSLKEYLPLMRSKKLLYYLLTICCCIQAYWVFIGLSPLLYIEDLGVPLTQFGFYQGAMAGAFAIFSLGSSLLLKKFGDKKCFYSGIVLIGAFLVGCAWLVLSETTSPMNITLVLLLLAVGLVFPINILWPLSLEVVPGAKGRIAAVMVASRFLFTSIALQIASYFYEGTFFSVGIIMIVSVLLSLWTCYLLFKAEKGILKGHSHTGWECHF